MADVAISPHGAALGADHEAAPERPDFQIVPRAGLPIVAAVIVLLIVAIAVNEKWPLMFLHVVAGASWTIIDLFLGFVIGPILGKLSVPARIELTTRLMPKMVLIMPTVVAVTLAAGWQLATKLEYQPHQLPVPRLGRGELHRGRARWRWSPSGCSSRRTSRCSSR